MIVLGIIPARAGSKGIPNKNLAMLAGRPLIAWTCETALASARLTHVAISTDSARIAEMAAVHGVATAIHRPPALAADDTPMLPVLRHALGESERRHGRVDAVVLLQPTSPLRTAAHVDAGVALLEGTGADCVVSVVPVPHRFSPLALMRLEGGRLTGYESGGGAVAVTRRQDKPELYARNGPAVLAIRRDALETCVSLYDGDCRALVMEPEESVDVDTPWDLAVAECALQRRTRQGGRP